MCVSGEDVLQIRGQNGHLLSCMDPLAPVCGRQEVMETAKHELETFYPVSPTIDLQKVHVYKEHLNCTGERLAVATVHLRQIQFIKSTNAVYKKTSLMLKNGEY